MSNIFDILWQDYRTISPQAEAIRKLLAVHNDDLINDHIALRTIDDPACGIMEMAKPFLAMGYTMDPEHYRFEQKHLNARYLIHEDDTLPKVFISALCLDELDPAVGTILRPILSAAPPNLSSPGRPWQCRTADYERLLPESEYAAWLLAFGWRANHFTVSVNHLQHFTDLDSLVAHLQAAGYAMNESGGLIKGTEAQCLRQASTLAASVSVSMDDGEHQLPGCYVEFAQRYPTADGRLYQGFIASSADKIFESTDRR